MDKHDGWLQYPEFILKYLDAIGAKHWADLFFREGIEKYLKDNKEPIIELIHSITEATGTNPDPEVAKEFLSGLLVSLEEDMKEDDDNPDNAQDDIKKIDVAKLTSDELKEHCDFWITYHVTFFNDLALATHGESIYSLVHKAVELKDDEALVKAIQVDRTLHPYFRDRLWDQAMRGNSNFFDSLSYRTNNAPRRGDNKHPLLWILFKELNQMGCLRSSITSKQILNVYQKAIPGHPKFSIDEELTVQRQRRKFEKLYRQAK